MWFSPEQRARMADKISERQREAEREMIRQQSLNERLLSIGSRKAPPDKCAYRNVGRDIQLTRFSNLAGWPICGALLIPEGAKRSSCVENIGGARRTLL